MLNLSYGYEIIVLQIKLVLKQREKATRKFVLGHVLEGVSLFEICVSVQTNI